MQSYHLVPGTKMNKMHNPTATAINMNKAMVALVNRSLRTKGSLIRDQFIQVYSLNPRYAAMMSSLYWYETRK
jgi:hypothetical protein